MVERLLVIGGTGMLGHRLVLEAEDSIETWWTSRSDGGPARALLPLGRLIVDVDIRRPDDVRRALEVARPTVVANCAGTVKQRTATSDTEMVATNAWFPHALADECDAVGARVIHLSTDCVFSGTGGDDRAFGYSVEHEPDPRDLYGRSKLVGEVTRAPHLTVRTSMVGTELTQGSGLLAWFLSASGAVRGYPNARFSGLSTPVLARSLLTLASRRDVTGLHHLAGPAIDKCSLLHLFRDAFRPGLSVDADDSVHVDRRLDGRPLDRVVGFTPPTWAEMVDEMAKIQSATQKEPG